MYSEVGISFGITVGQSYQISDTISERTMLQCLCILHCTVWAQADCNESTTLYSFNAKMLQMILHTY